MYLYKLFKGTQPISAVVYVAINPEQCISYYSESLKAQFAPGSLCPRDVKFNCPWWIFSHLSKIQGNMPVVRLYYWQWLCLTPDISIFNIRKIPEIIYMASHFQIAVCLRISEIFIIMEILICSLIWARSMFCVIFTNG